MKSQSKSITKPKQKAKPAEEPRKHSVLAPSAAHRWLACPGSVALIEECHIKETDSEHANEGTAAHELLEACLFDLRSPHKFLKHTFNDIAVTREMADAVEVAVDYVRDLSNSKLKPTVLVEEPVVLEILDYKDDMGGGHVDIIALYKNTFEVIDYKHGSGVAVEVEDNPQLMLYAIGVAERINWKFDAVKLTIIQPRIPHHPQGVIRSISILKSDLRKFELAVEIGVDAIGGGSTTFNPGKKQCQWCPVRAQCPAIAEHAVKQAGMDFSEFLQDAKPAPASTLTNEQLSSAMHNIDVVKLWIKSVEEYVFGKLQEDPDLFPDFKLVEGRSQRKWKNPEATMAALKKLGFDVDQYAPRQLVGIGDGEKLIKPKEREDFMAAHAEKPPGKPTIALASDPRPRLANSPAQDFKEFLE